MKYTIREAMDYSKKGNIKEWIQLYLRDTKEEHASPNVALADGLLLEERFYYGPLLFELNKITTVRTEKDLSGNELKYYNEIVNEICDNYDNYSLPPLILEYKNNNLYLTDGNHRYSALCKLNIKEYYVIIWGNKNKEHEFLKSIN